MTCITKYTFDGSYNGRIRHVVVRITKEIVMLWFVLLKNLSCFGSYHRKIRHVLARITERSVMLWFVSLKNPSSCDLFY